MGTVLQFFEYDRLRYHATYLSDKGKTVNFTESQISAFNNFYTRSNGVYYNLEDKGIRFKEQVGVIQINDLTIEVLPKIDREDVEKGKWHDVLIHMLKECKFMDPQSSGYANLRLRSNSVLELYFENFIRELELLLHQGLIKRYRTQEGNQNAMKGKLLFNQHIQQNLTHGERFFVEHTLFDEYHLLHQVLGQALDVVQKLMERSVLSDRINRLKGQWPCNKPVKVNEQLFARFPSSRKTKPYQEALQIARMILLNYHPDLRGGRESILALMFDMNKLWEEFIFRRLKACESHFNWAVTDQRKFQYWLGDSGGKNLIPDILIDTLDGRKIIIDTKWKCPDKNKPDDHDLRQLLAYKLYYQSDNAFLLYPCYNMDSFFVQGKYQSRPYQSKTPVFRDTFGLDGGLLFLNVLNDQRLITKAEFRLVVENLFEI